MSSTKFVEERILLVIERKAASAVTARRLVKIDGTNHDQVSPAAANDPSLGVALNSAATGESVAVAVLGIVMVDAGGSVAIDNEIVSDVNGKAVVRGTTATVLYQVSGRALNAAASGEQVCMQLGRYSVWGANAS